MIETEGVAESLRQPFAESFSRAETDQIRVGERLLAIRAGGAALMLRVKDLSAIFRAEKIVPLPGSRRALIGLSGLRGQVVPVFLLGELLGARDASRPTWLALVGRENPVALAFDDFEGYHEAFQKEFHVPDHAGTGLKHVVSIHGTGPAARGLVDVLAVVRELKEGNG